MLQGRSKAQLLAANYHKVGGQAKWWPFSLFTHKTSLCPKIETAIKTFLQTLDIYLQTLDMQED